MRKELDTLKKVGALALVALLAGSTAISYPVAAKENLVPINESKEQKKEEKETTNFIKFSGAITQIEKAGKRWTLTVEDKEGVIMHLIVNDQSHLFNSKTAERLDQSSLKVGTTVEAYYDKNKPMLLIYPAQVTPEFMIIKDEKNEGQVKVGQFDKEFLSLDGQLKVNIGKETVLENQLGETINKADLADKDSIVFYSSTTRSIPPQTTPSKIIAYDDTAETKARVNEIVKNDHIMKDGVKMIPLRKVATALGYHVESIPKAKSVLVTKQNLSYTIKLSDKVYGYNRSIGRFEVAPIMSNQKTYVEENFLKLLLENK